MEKSIEDKFLDLFKDGGIACIVVDALVQKYDLGHQKGFYKDNPLQKRKELLVREEIMDVDNSLSIDLEAMFSEIENNLLRCKDDVAKENYCIELVLPFARYLNSVNPMHLSEERTLEIENGFSIILHKKSEWYSVEGYFRKIVQMFMVYADWLDWILLKNGIDLQVIQKKCGVYLKSPGRFAHHYLQWAGTIENGQRLIDALPKTGGTKVLPEELNTDEAKALFQTAIDNGLLNADYSTTDLTRTAAQKALLAEIISEKLQLKKKWKPFEELWGVKNLAQQRYTSKEHIGKVGGGTSIMEAFGCK